jgi:hypothetical protein
MTFVKLPKSKWSRAKDAKAAKVLNLLAPLAGVARAFLATIFRGKVSGGI